MLNVLLVGCGGFVGAILRYLGSSWVQRVSGSESFPWGTMAVNIAGCFLIGILGGLAENQQILTPHARLLLITGLLGGFTTFSSFGYETSGLVRSGDFAMALANIGLSILFGLAAVWVGYTITTLKG